MGNEIAIHKMGTDALGVKDHRQAYSLRATAPDPGKECCVLFLDTPIPDC